MAGLLDYESTPMRICLDNYWRSPSVYHLQDSQQWDHLMYEHLPAQP